MYQSIPTPAIGFSGFSGAGKTTLIEQLVAELKQHGLRIGVIKHDGHDFEIDHEGKDSHRFAQAGADMTVISSGAKTAFIEQRSLSLEALLLRMTNVDLILVEGYKDDQTLPQIGVCRTANGKGFPSKLSRYEAVVTDGDIDASIPRFDFDEIGELAEFIMEILDLE